MSANIPLVRLCEVISVDDDLGMDRIKVNMIPNDNMKKKEDFPFAFPLLPKHFFVKPKVGECVLVFTSIATNGDSQRYYIGPVIPQINKMQDNLYGMRGASYLDRKWYSQGKSPYLFEKSEGIYPKSDDISIIGKNNTDIQLKDNDIRIRCGARKNDISGTDNLLFNDFDPAYIKLRYNPNKSDEDGYKSSVNIVADKINLIGHKSRDHFKTTDKYDLFTDEELDRFLKEAHALPFGDMLVDFLKKLRDAFLKHTHPYNMLPPCVDDSVALVSKYELDKILSDTVKIN